MNLEDKTKFIYHKINEINENKNTKDIIFYIESNNINYSLNNNGLILNISVLDEIHINNLYDIMNSLLIDNDENKSNVLIPKTYKSKVGNDKCNTYIPLELTPLQVEILKLI